MRLQALRKEYERLSDDCLSLLDRNGSLMSSIDTLVSGLHVCVWFAIEPQQQDSVIQEIEQRQAIGLLDDRKQSLSKWVP